MPPPHPDFSLGLALVMIVKDEEHCIKRALDSFAPWVDEMVVLDTGSQDATVEVATRCGARVEHFEWMDDFSAARNAALDRTESPYRVIVDADEWLIEGGATLLAWARARPPGMGVIRREDSTEVDGVRQSALTSITRVLPQSVRYRGRIHEQPDGTRREVIPGVLFGHDGYLPGRNEKKLGRNERLLRLDLADGTAGDDGYTWYSLGKDLEVQRRYAEAQQAYHTALQQSAPTEPWRHDLVVRQLHVLGRNGLFEEARRYFSQESREWPESSDLFFVMGNNFLDEALSSEAHSRRLIAMAHACWSRCLAIGESDDLEGHVDGRGSFLAQHNLDVIDGKVAAPFSSERSQLGMTS